jgi:hypothetical protein
MRRLLIWIIVLEGAALAAAGALLLFGVEDRARLGPGVPVFRPPIYDGVIGEFVRYQKLDRESGAVLGYLDYGLSRVVEYEGTVFGREFTVEITEKQEGGARRRRVLVLRPRASDQGWLPPVYEEELRAGVAGAQPVVQRIATAPVPFRRGQVPGFLVETVIPRRSLTETAERLWFTERVPVFGVTRWETGDFVYVLHASSAVGAK